jgi:hypothetical protein
MVDTLVCWRCGASLAHFPLPLARSAECEKCRADLHVCRLCEFFDPRLGKQCREPVAEDVKDKDRANFCGYFQAKAGVYVAPDTGAAQKARAELNALFGGAENLPTATPSSARSAADLAREQLDRLFGAGKGGVEKDS